jgi:hypothetical protein
VAVEYTRAVPSADAVTSWHDNATHARGAVAVRGSDEASQRHDDDDTQTHTLEPM